MCQLSLCRLCGKFKLLVCLAAMSSLALLAPSPSRAQTQQPFLFATQGINGEFTGIAVFVRNDQTGNLNEVANSPFTAIHSLHCTIGVIDPQGRFGYGVCGLGASMYNLDGTTGAVEEAVGSLSPPPPTRIPSTSLPNPLVSTSPATSSRHPLVPPRSWSPPRPCPPAPPSSSCSTPSNSPSP
jgi:hypothetical protein